MKKILLVDDDLHILKLVTIHLSQAGYDVLQAKHGSEALERLQKENVNLAVVDVMMPFVDGYTLTREIRRLYDIPVILLTAKSQIEDKEQGFSAGTDDYLVKPFEPKELLFRIQALLRRYDKEEDAFVIKLGQTSINKKSYEVKVRTKTLLLPLREFELLAFLATNSMRVFSRENLIEHVWGLDYEGDSRTVDVHIKRLRERFAGLTDDFHIKTVRGVGYSLETKQS
ncbi:DNA-binding response regulator [Priestia aryabhattai]|uniref:response regulator transcription factor n=1 Tax=Bacillaceae TaxID=186817 RepID=UPI000BA04665|nr:MULTISPECIES: response regulator transcription factor [Bacillaceae]MBY6023587.1 response regulator transcription factor [Nitratireductor sp. DP7N14-4]OZT12810.1 DNA-binding response regulator [Priestia aryabhattai]USY55599.1 response regulator transcription factor [Bacillus sp. 1780r2a1]MDT2048322.1 response regulator transcription factor [Priestia flexa]TDB53728.1 response regulator transcription factor [Bacillus sp. CBEL-1]